MLNRSHPTPAILVIFTIFACVALTNAPAADHSRAPAVALQTDHGQHPALAEKPSEHADLDAPLSRRDAIRMLMERGLGDARQADHARGSGGPIGPMPMESNAQCQPEWTPVFGSGGSMFSPDGQAQAGVSIYAMAQAVFDDGSGSGPALYVGGSILTAGTQIAHGIARWDGESWSPVGGGLTGGTGSPTVFHGVLAMTVFDDGSGPALFTGGDFTSAGGAGANYIAKWDGESWSPLGAGLNDAVWTLAVFDDGSGPALYAGGGFTTAGGVSANYIAKWDGESWSAVGGGMNDWLDDLYVFDDGSGPALYAGGAFTLAGGAAANRIAKWDGVSGAWSPLGAGLNGNVNVMTAFDDGTPGSGEALYVGGGFTEAGGATALFIARWDGLTETWTPVSSINTGMNGSVFTLTVHDDGGGPALYAGGAFNQADFNPATGGGWGVNGVARWDGSSWSDLNCGMQSLVNWVIDLEVYEAPGSSGPTLFAGGAFVIAGYPCQSGGGVKAYNVAEWDGSNWAAIAEPATGLDGGVQAMTVFDDPFGGGGGPALYVGGKFTSVGEVQANGILKWDGQTVSALDEGVSGHSASILAMAVFDDGFGDGPALYIGGTFTSASGVSGTAGIAKWDGESWSSVGGGSIGNVHALAVFDDGSGPALYAGGHFPAIGGVSVNHIAKWDGQAWSGLGADCPGWPGCGANPGLDVRALAVYDDGSGPSLYAGGSFTMVSGIAANRIARWDGVSGEWSPLGSGTSGAINTLAVFDDAAGGGPALYAGGAFHTAGGVDAVGIARWDGSSWTSLGKTLDQLYSQYIYVLEAFDDGTGDGPSLYVGGRFWSMGGVSGTDSLARWDGASGAWSPLGVSAGGPVVDTVTALAAFDPGPAGSGSGARPALFAGGGFIASVTGDSYLARWQGCPPAPGVPGDLTGDGSVGVPDLLILLGAWGECANCQECPADLTGDCNVGIADLLILLANWG